MKKWLAGFIIGIFVLCGSWSVFAGPARFGDPHRGPQGGPRDRFQDNRRDRELQNDCRYIIHRTAQVIFEAQRAAERGHRSFGLARAVFAQQRSRQLYMSGNYQDAIFFSLRARRMAVEVIRANNFRVRPDFFPDRLESRYDHQGPSDDELDRRMNNDRGRMGRDDDAIRIKIELDL